MKKIIKADMVKAAKWGGVGISILSIVFAIMTYFGVWNYLRGDNLLVDLADRLDTSYADVPRQVRRSDKEWQPLIRVIRKYTHSTLPKNKKPMVFVRMVAVASAKAEVEGKLLSEWTAPTTQIVLLYKDWPEKGVSINSDDFRVVGTLQSLHDWIDRDENDFNFLFGTIIFGVLSTCMAITLALKE